MPQPFPDKDSRNTWRLRWRSNGSRTRTPPTRTSSTWRYRVTAQNLDETTIEYLSYLPGDTPDDEKRGQQINYLDDDIESLADAEYYERKERGETDGLDEEYNIPDTLRQQQERERHDRRHSRRDAVLPERYK
eukprot:5758295-Amphidinium_carterae.1